MSVEPSTITLDSNQHHATVKVTSLSADPYFSSDQQFTLTHTTSSCDLEMHRLALKLNCYQLSQISKELIGAGCDDHFQMANPATFEKFITTKYNRDWARAPHPFSDFLPSAKPLEIGDPKEPINFLMVSAGRHHSACLCIDGSVYTWGVGIAGQLGLSKQEIVNYDFKCTKQVHPLQDQVQYSDKLNFTCLIDEEAAIDVRDPEVWVPCVARPVMVKMTAKVKYLECGAYHTMAITVEN